MVLRYAVLEASMNKLVISLALMLAIPGIGHAKTFKLGDDKPVATIMIPDSWSPEEIDNGVEGTSKDGETYVAAEVVDAKNLNAAVDDGLKYFQKNGVKIDPATLEKKEQKIAGFDAVALEGKGTDKDGPTHVSLTLVIISGEKIVLLTYWGTATGEESNGPDLNKIASSIAAAK
jgi:hypothetical protein